ncbi:MAG: hypothetical protein WAW36_00425 [Methylovulum miyakonense]
MNTRQHLRMPEMALMSCDEIASGCPPNSPDLPHSDFRANQTQQFD